MQILYHAHARHERRYAAVGQDFSKGLELEFVAQIDAADIFIIDDVVG